MTLVELDNPDIGSSNVAASTDGRTDHVPVSIGESLTHAVPAAETTEIPVFSGIDIGHKGSAPSIGHTDSTTNDADHDTVSDAQKVRNLKERFPDADCAFLKTRLTFHAGHAGAVARELRTANIGHRVARTVNSRFSSLPGRSTSSVLGAVSLEESRPDVLLCTMHHGGLELDLALPPCDATTTAYDASIASNDVRCRGSKHAVASLTTAHAEIPPPPSLDKRRAPFGEEGESRPDGSSAVTSTGDVCPEGFPPPTESGTPGPIHKTIHGDHLGAPPAGQGSPARWARETY